MERYIKPLCEIVEMVDCDNLLDASIGTHDDVGQEGVVFAPKQNDITSSSPTSFDLWGEEESEMGSYVDVCDK